MFCKRLNGKSQLIVIFFLIFIAKHGAYAGEPPAGILDLSRWKLTLPYARKEGGKSPLEVFQPMLAKFQDPECFFINETGDGVVFRAKCVSVSTKNSSYPRCELREMAGGKPGRVKQKVKAKWSTSDGMLHRMTVTQAITAVPPVKKHVVSAQIHNAGDDVIMIRLEDKKLFVERNRFGDVMLDPEYELGAKFVIKIEACDDHIRVWYNGSLKMDWEVARKGCYFKAGCYTQSNTSKGDKPESYGEVVIYDLKLTHVKQNLQANAPRINPHFFYAEWYNTEHFE